MIASVSSAAADKPLRPRGELRALDGLGVFGPRENLPSAGDFDQLDSVTVLVVVPLYLFERGDNVLRRRFVVGDHVRRSDVATGWPLAKSAASSSFARGVTCDLHGGEWARLGDSQLARLGQLEQREKNREYLPRLGVVWR